MKKILLSLLLLLVASAVFAQHPIGNDSLALQTLGNSNTLVKSKGAIGADSGFVNSAFADTAAANRSKIKNYPGAQIRTGNIIWLRNSDATQWIEIGTGSGAGDTTLTWEQTLNNQGALPFDFTHNTDLGSNNFTLSNSNIFTINTNTGNSPYSSFQIAPTYHNLITIGDSTEASILVQNSNTPSTTTARLQALNALSSRVHVIRVNPDSILINGGLSGADQTDLRIRGLPYGNDTSIVKPVVVGANGKIYTSSWYGSGAGAGGIRDTAYLVQGPGIYINNFDSTYKPNGFDVQIAADTAYLRNYFNQFYDNSTTINDSLNTIFIVDSISNSPPAGAVDGNDYLVGTSPTGLFAGHANDIAELVGGVYTFTDPVAQQQLIVDNPVTYATYQFNGTIWVPTSILWRVNGNRNLGQNAWIGRPDKAPVTVRARNLPVVRFDTTRDVKFYKFVGTRPGNYAKFDSATGNIDTGFFRPLIEGPGITITAGPVGDTISSIGGSGSAVFANEGLTKDVDTIKLGGTLNSARTISAGTFNLIISGNKSTSGGILNVTNSNTGTSATAISTTGAISASRNSSTATAYAMSASNTQGTGLNVTGTSTTLPSAILNNASNGSGQYIGLKIVNTNNSSANGNGIYQNFELYNAGAAARTTNRFLSRWVDNSAETSEFVISGLGATAQTDLLSLLGTGAAKLNQYGSGTFTGTAAYGLSVDASGNIIETTPGGGGSGGGVNIYNADSSLASNRVVDLDGNYLQIQHGGNNFLSLDPASGSENVTLQSYNTTGNDNTASFSGNTTNTSSESRILSSFNDLAKYSLIDLDADATTSRITYTADEHTINGTVYIPNGTPANGLTLTASANGGFVQSAELDNVNGFRMKYGNTDLGGGMRRNIGNNAGELRIFSDSSVNDARMTFYTKGSRAMLIDSNRNVLVDNRVGIGTSSPLTLLHVGAGSASPIQTIGTYPGIIANLSTTRGQITLIDANGNQGGFLSDGSRFYSGTSSNTNVFVIQNNVPQFAAGPTGVVFERNQYNPTFPASAIVTLNSTTQGFLPPRMTATQASAISSPEEGLLVYVTNTNGTFTSKGWWGWNGAAWEKLNN